jgi:hypothetical protein
MGRLRIGFEYLGSCKIYSDADVTAFPVFERSGTLYSSVFSDDDDDDVASINGGKVSLSIIRSIPATLSRHELSTVVVKPLGITVKKAVKK